ncbi:hypothetical protein ABIF76_002193 [Bradyrhizobium ottawaense]
MTPRLLVGDTVGGALLEGEVVVRHGEIVLALALIGEAAQVEGNDIIRIEIDRDGQGLDRVVVIALADQRVAAHGERDGLVLAAELVGLQQIVAGARAGLGLRLAVTAEGEIVGLRVGRRAEQAGRQDDEGQGNDAQHGSGLLQPDSS